MYCCELLRAHGFRVKTHPTTGTQKSRHPDFLVLRDDTPVCYFECTLAADPMIDPAEQARKNTIMDALNRIDPGPYILMLEFVAVGSASPSVARLRHEVEAWVRSLEERAREDSSTPPSVSASRSWRLDGWELAFTAYRSSNLAKATEERRGIAGHMEGIRYVDSSGRLRRALSQKAKRYGSDLGLPYIVAVNSMDTILEDYDVMEALFGEMRIVMNIKTGQHHEERAPNGIWRRRGDFQYRRMSGVLVVGNLVPWTLWTAPLKLWHHPDPRHPLDPSDWRIPQMLYDESQHMMIERSGETGAAVLGLERCDAA